MKKELALFALALGLASTAPAFADEQKVMPKKEPVKKQQPVKMTEQQLDQVAGGALLNVVAIDVVDVEHVLNNPRVGISAPIAVGILSAGVGAASFQAIE